MGVRRSARYITAVVAVILCAGSAAQAQVATFSDVNDAVPARFFDAEASAPDVLDPNKLVIGLHAGRDWTTWKDTEFRASTAAYSYTTAADTISVAIHAPEGYYIARVTYAQRGAGSMYRTGKAAGASSWVVAGFAGDLGTFGTNPALTATLDLTGLGLTSVPVSITTALFAYSTPSLGSANVAVTGADLAVELLPLTE